MDIHSPSLATAESISVNAQGINFPALTKVDMFRIVGTMAATIKAPVLSVVKQMTIVNNSKLTTDITFPELSKVEDYLNIENNPATSIHLGKISSIKDFIVHGNEKLEKLALEGSAVVINYRVTNNGALQSIFSPSITQGDSIIIGFNPKLTSVDMSGLKKAKKLHVEDLSTNPNGCVKLGCFDKADDFAVFWCGHTNKTAPLCSAKASWSCVCK